MDVSAQISRVAKRYESEGHPAAGAVNLTIPLGEAVAVMGPAGSATVTGAPGRTAAAAVPVTQEAAVALAARSDDRLDVSDAWCEVLFASALQPSDAPTAEAVAEAFNSTVRRFGIGGCVGRMAQEFGDHLEAAVERMRWVCRLAAEALVVLDTDAVTARSARRDVRA